ncbi:MAG TPA: DUF4142 domain-containing protein [Chthoniobacterales bacterium]|nr:DUF4142 domain-containing protein [Chthoniobacterales bacterium]
MKNHLSLLSRFAVVALATGGLCYGSSASAETKPGTAYATPTPENLSSMASSRVKPNKAELAKMKADKEAKAGNSTAAGTQASTTALDSQDRDFLMAAGKGGMEEVDMGKMAAKKGQSAEVKNIGKMMVTDHSKANKELMALAKKKGVQLNAGHTMAKMDDANFDHAYLDQMVMDHKKTIATFEKEAKKGKDADVKAWASQTLPTLKKHLSTVQAAQKTMKKAG